jgi:hypothetical protein
MNTTNPIPRGYIRISTRFAYAPLRVGLSLMSLATGREVYFQPGDHESAIRDTIDAIGECDESQIDRAADLSLGPYFD